MTGPIRSLAVAVAVVVAAALLGAAAPGAIAQTRTPLLIGGKSTLYQRVLTRPGVRLADTPGGAGRVLPAMSVLYVFDRKDGVLEVGARADAAPQGFLAESETIAWQHTLVMAFANPAGRGRVLFFKDRESLLAGLDAGPPAAVAGAPGEAGLSPSELRSVVPHQAGSGIVRFTGMQLEGLGIESELVNGLTRNTGNVSACSVPHALHHEWQRLHGLDACPTAAVGSPGEPEVLQGCVLLRSTPHHDHRASVAA